MTGKLPNIYLKLSTLTREYLDIIMAPTLVFSTLGNLDLTVGN